MRVASLFAFICVHSWLIAQPLWFEPNHGQTHRSVEFLAHTSKGFVYLAHDKLAIRDVRMDLVGARKHAQAELEEPTGGISSYFIGRSEKEWHTGVPHYGRVRYKNVYAGIDLVYYGNERDIEYDFVVKPGADPGRIKLAYNKPVRIDSGGDLVIAGLWQHRPRVLQNGREIACDYLVSDGKQVQLAIADYDRSKGLTIDPVLEFSTYLGGVAEESGHAIAMDSAGFVYLAGGSQAPAAPDLNPFQQTTAVIASPVVFKMTPDGRRIIYYAYVGNGSWDHAYGVAVDATGNAVITGQTRNPNFPLKNAFQTTFKAVWDNAFFTKLSPDGKSLVYSSYLGGGLRELPASGLGLDPQGNAFIAGQTQSADFPTVNAFQPKFGGGSADCYLAKISPTGVPLWSTFFGGSGSDWCYAVTVDSQGNSYITGGSNSTDIALKNPMQTTITPRNGFTTPVLAKFAPDGSLLASTFLGGPIAGAALAVTVDVAGNVYIGGNTDAKLVTKNAFQPQSTGPYSGFLLEIDKSWKDIIFATYFGGSNGDSVRSIALDASGSIYVLGSATSPDFPVKNSFQSFIGGGICQCDMFVAKFAPGAQSLIYSTIMGGHNGEFPGQIVVDAASNAYIIGSTISQDFPTKNAYQPTFGGAADFVFFKISDNTPLGPSPLKPNPGRLSFRFTQGGAVPVAQTVNVSGPAFTTGKAAPWLTAKANGSNVTVSVDPTGLAPNTYTASVSLIPLADTPASIDVTLIVLSPPPLLTSVEPVLVPIGSSSTTVTIHGSGFAKDSVVLVNSVPWMPVTFIDANTLRLTLPENYFTVEYNHTIAVKNPTSDLSNVLSLAVGTPPPMFTASGVVNAASFAPGPVAPGEIVTIFGTNLTGAVTFDNIPATLVYASPTQVSATVPYAVSGPSTNIQVGSSVPVKLDVAPSAPGIFVAVRAVDNILTLYTTGCGTLTNDDLPRCALPVSVTVNDQAATVLYAGVAPGLVQGVNQINFRLPDGITTSQLSIVLTAGDASSEPFSFTL